MYLSFPSLAPPPPVVTVGVAGDYVAGSTLSLLCTSTPPIPLVQSSKVLWVGVATTDPYLVVTESNSFSVSNATVTFDPLSTSHGGQYICQADYDVPAANLSSNPRTQLHTLTVQSECTVVEGCVVWEY